MRTITMTAEDIQGAKTLGGVPMDTWGRILEDFARSEDRELKVRLHFRTVWRKAYSSLFASNKASYDGGAILPIQTRYDDREHAVIITKK